MNERLRARQEITTIEVNQSFKPFEKAMLPRKTSNDPNSDFEFVTSTSFMFRGIKIDFTLLTDHNPEYDKEKETPLGKVRKVVSFSKENGKFLEKTPLILSISAEITNPEQYKVLEQIRIEIFIGNVKKLLHIEDKYSKKEISGLIKKDNNVKTWFEPEDDTTLSAILLPWNASKLATIEARIVEKPKAKTSRQF